jgi:PRC-barrel domain
MPLINRRLSRARNFRSLQKQCLSKLVDPQARPSRQTSVTDWYKQNVYGPNENKIGDIKDVLVDKSGKVVALIVGVGGFLGAREKDVFKVFNIAPGAGVPSSDGRSKASRSVSTVLICRRMINGLTTIGSQPVIKSAEALSACQPSPCGPSSGNHPNIRTSRPLAPALECSDVRLVGQETRKRVLELRNPVTVPREIGSLSRMDDNRTNIKVSQQCRDLVFGDWASAAIFVPLRIGMGEKLLHHLLPAGLQAAIPQGESALTFSMVASSRALIRRRFP